MTITGSATKSCQPLKPESLVLQLLLPGCEASRLHACHPTCLEGWLSRLKAPHYFLTRTPLELLCSGTAAAPCAGRLLPLWRRRRWAIMEETRLLMMTTPTSSVAMRRSTSVIIHCRYFYFVLMFVILNALALDVCTPWSFVTFADKINGSNVTIGDQIATLQCDSVSDRVTYWAVLGLCLDIGKDVSFIMVMIADRVSRTRNVLDFRYFWQKLEIWFSQKCDFLGAQEMK